MKSSINIQGATTVNKRIRCRFNSVRMLILVLEHKVTGFINTHTRCTHQFEAYFPIKQVVYCTQQLVQREAVYECKTTLRRASLDTRVRVFMFSTVSTITTTHSPSVSLCGVR